MPVTEYSKVGRSYMGISLSRKVFIVFNYFIMILTAVFCLFPLVHIFAVSLSSGVAAMAGDVSLLPVDFTFSSYSFFLERPEFFQSLKVSIERLLLAVPISMTLTVLSAYPLSKSPQRFKGRGIYVWFFLITILFSGGLIPTYMVVRNLGLIDKIWALFLPGAVPVFNILVLLNFFRGLPSEIEDAIFVDGAGQWRALWSVYIPLSMPAIATILLFTIVGNWNDWFAGLIYMNRMSNYPLQSYLQTVVIASDLKSISALTLAQAREISQSTSRAALIFVGTLPILCVYPFLQRYFVKGFIIGSIKG
jgi:putative aldouronate transport system permease protein